MTNLINPSDRIAIFGARGMAGSAISRALARAGYQQQLAPTRAELDLLDLRAVQQWFAEFQPTVVLAAAKVGGIRVNLYPADFLPTTSRRNHGSKRPGFRVRWFLLLAAAASTRSRRATHPGTIAYRAALPTNECYAIAKIAGIKLRQASATAWL